MRKKAEKTRRAKRIKRGRDMTKKDTSWVVDFLAMLEVIPNITEAATHAQVHRSTVYARMKAEPKFAEACDSALAAGVNRLEGKLLRRAYEGDKKPMAIGGKAVWIVEYPDHLAMFLLRAHLPEKYRERKDIRVEESMTISGLMARADELDPDETGAPDVRDA